MEDTTTTLARLRRLATSMDPGTPEVERALPALRRLLEAAAVAFRIVGGLAVVHHGYARTTEDVDVLLAESELAKVQPLLAAHGFSRVTRTQLRHDSTGVRIDLLFAGDPMPRSADRRYPAPESVTASPLDPEVIGLPGLIELKLAAGRYRDVADVVELLKRLEDAAYFDLESQVDRSLRPRLAELRRDALDELA